MAPKRKLCAACKACVSSKIHHPTHLVHPKTGEHMLFDIRGEAVCPQCGARWRRIGNKPELVG